jgi:hypothetical protein
LKLTEDTTVAQILIQNLNENLTALSLEDLTDDELNIVGGGDDNWDDKHKGKYDDDDDKYGHGKGHGKGHGYGHEKKDKYYYYPPYPYFPCHY